MTPYYQDDLVTLYHGDCRELLPQMSADYAHICITDLAQDCLFGDVA